MTKIAGAFFTTYEGVKSMLTKANPILTGSSSPIVPQPFIHSAASAVVELVSCFILTPAEVLKQNAQMIRRPVTDSTSKMFQSSVTIQALKHFSNPEQLWSGYTMLAARNLPFASMQFPMFEHMKSAIKARRINKGAATGSLAETALITTVSAGSAGSVAAIITRPVDVVKTRIMLSAASDRSEFDARKRVEAAKNKGQTLDALANKKDPSGKSGLVVAREVLKESGVKGLFRGWTLRAVWTALGSGLYLGVYESGKVWLVDRHGGEG